MKLKNRKQIAEKKIIMQENRIKRVRHEIAIGARSLDDGEHEIHKAKWSINQEMAEIASLPY